MYLQKKMVVRVAAPGDAWDGRLVYITGHNYHNIWFCTYPAKMFGRIMQAKTPLPDELTGRLFSTSHLGPARRPRRRAEP